MGISIGNLKTPIAYTGGDNFTTYANAKNIAETGWVFANNRLGAPFGTCFLDFPPYFLDNVGNLITKLLLVFTHDYVLALNINYISIPFISFAIAFFVMQEMRITRLYAWCGALSFSLIPYYFMRNVGHFVLAEIYFIPLTILICFWCFDNKLSFNDLKKMLDNKYNILVLLFSALIANNGIGYYQVFSCFFILSTGIISLIETKQLKSAISNIVTIGIITLFFFANFIPALSYRYSEGKNPKAAQRQAWESDLYGLKISQMLIPQTIAFSQKMDLQLKSYHANTPLSYGRTNMDEPPLSRKNRPANNENNMAYLGVLASLGFLSLLYQLLKKPIIVSQDDENNVTRLLAKLNLCGVLLATVGGFGTIIGVLFTPIMRGYNRISVFIAFISLCGFFLIVQNLKINKQNATKMFMLVVTLIALGVPFHKQRMDYSKTTNEVNSDRKFAESIESNVPKGSMIYQLPYHAFPESGPVNNMLDYHEFVGFLYSKQLKWSYGGIRGRQSDNWSKQLAQLPLEEKIKCLSIVGFQGIMVDSRAYKEKELAELDNSLQALLQTHPLISLDTNLRYYDFDKYNKSFLSSLSSEKAAKMKKRMMHIGNGMVASGFYDEEKNKQGIFRWMEKAAKIEFENLDDPYLKTLHFIAYSSGKEAQDFTVNVNGVVYSYKTSDYGAVISLPVNISKGKNTIAFSSTASRVDTMNDNRDMHVRLQNFDIAEIERGFLDVLNEDV